MMPASRCYDLANLNWAASPVFPLSRSDRGHLLRRTVVEQDEKTVEQVVSELAQAERRIAELEALEGQRRANDVDLPNGGTDYSDLLENASDLVQSVAPDGRLLYVNRAWCDTLGYSREEALALTLFDIIHPDSLPHCIETFQKVMAGEGVQGVEAVFVAKDGRQIAVEGCANCRIEQGKPLHTRGIFREVTERTKIRQVLEERERLYRLLAENVTDVIWTLDMDLRFTYISPSVERLRGYTVDEAMAQTMEESLTPESYQVALQAFLEEMKLEAAGEGARMPLRARTVELEQLCKDGSVVPVEVNVTFLRDEKGAPVGVLGVTRDVSERKRAEDLVRSLFAGSPIGIYIVQRGRFRMVNASFQELTGYGADELIGMKSVDIVHPDDRDVVRRAAIAMLKGERSTPYELRYVTKSGATRWFMETVTSISYEGERAALGNFMGVTEFKEAQQAVEASERRYRLLADNVTDVIWTADMNLKTTYVSPSVERLLGYSVEEAVGHAITEALNEESVATVRTALQEDPGGSSVQLPMRRQDGGIVWTETTMSLLRGDGAAQGTVVGVTRDISERKRSEDELRESEERYRTLVENTNDVIFNLDPQGQFLYVSPSIQTVAGYAPQEVAGWEFTRYVHPDDLPGLLASLERTLAGELEPHEFRVVGKDGAVRFVRTSSRPVWRKGRIVGLTGIMSDITQRKLMEQKLQEYSENLERMVEERTKELREAQDKLVRTEKLAAIGEVAGGLAHELRSPLAAMRFSAYFLKAKLGDAADPKVRRHLDLLEEEVDVCDQTVAQVLDFARPGTLQREEVDINAVVEGALGEIDLPSNVHLRRQLEYGLAAVTADTAQMRQVVSNLVTNAIQAMPDGGGLTVITSQREDFVEVKVADTGVGIPQENLGKVFEPLFTTKAKGIGLGLAVVKAVVDRQGGSIDVQSRVGEGTVFTVRLPVVVREVSGLE